MYHQSMPKGIGHMYTHCTYLYGWKDKKELFVDIVTDAIAEPLYKWDIIN